MKAYRLIIALSVLIFAACSSDSSDDQAQESYKEHVATLRLNVSREHFTDEPQTRTEGVEWEDGERLYIRFKNGNDYVNGVAQYSEATDSWSISYQGTLVRNETTQCVVTYFENPKEVAANKVILSPQSIAFEDEAATYFCVSLKEITINANLKHKTGRIRFKGEVGDQISIVGLSYYTEYDVDYRQRERTASSVDDPLPLTVQADGYTPYLYGWFTTDTKDLSLYVSDYQYYNRTCELGTLAVGKSGYMDIPSIDSHNGWWYYETAHMEGQDICCNNGKYAFKYTMIPVEGGTFMMGNEASTGWEVLHEVTLSSYSIGQTEVPQELWEAVMGSNPSNWKGARLPVECVSWNDCQAFILKLNKLTGQQFHLPTEAEWEFAARGGNKSKGYIYSGSDNIDEVAWYKSNSDSKTHDVATKLPNELGVYDMSGNVIEWCNDWYDQNYYKISPSKDPQGPESGGYRSNRGGDWRLQESDCSVFHRIWDAPSSKYKACGLRLAQ